MFLSIVIPVYKVEDYVEKCLISCENQDVSSSEYEIVVVNDGSPDRSLDIVVEVSKRYSNIKIISQENKGLSAARNTGLKNANGQYIMFVDSDDWIAENCLGKIISKLRKESPDALLISVANVFDDGLKIKQNYLSEEQITGKELLKQKVSPCAQYAIWSSIFLIKHNLVFYEGILHEDSEFTPRAYYLAEKISFTNDIIYYVFQNPNSITRSTNPKKSYDLIEYVCEHLSVFSDSVEKEYKHIFHNMISMYINNALANIAPLGNDEKKKLNECLYNHRHLFKHLRNSTLSKYKLEWLLFQMASKQYTGIFQFLKKL